MKIKFREIKKECRSMVEKFREKRHDDRECPEFLIHAVTENGSRGEVHLYRKAARENAYVSKKKIYYESFPELAVILESLGNHWDLTRPSA
jgi:hypothetical protein